ncbi:MAG: 30S ribosomal protein S12 methylthiotransferase RimO [Phycisphaerales bacterium]|nr:30S ribosomal protein S12 methylthiotransferase RimO [Phycisphaerales bacterium]
MSADPDIRTVSFVSLGCPKNLVDSEKMLGLLAQGGLRPLSYDAAAGFDGADAVVVNTCGFLEASKEESLGVIGEALRAKEAGQVKRVIVAGCLVQRHRAKLLEWAPGVDSLIGVFDRDKIVEAVMGRSALRADSSTHVGSESRPTPPYWIAGNALQAARDRGMSVAGLTVSGKDGKGIGYFEDDGGRLRLTPRHYAYLRVSEGCNQNCAFCTIPSIRGKMRSKPLDRIVSEAAELIRDGAFELNLIGQDTTSYGDDLGRSALRADGMGVGSENRPTQGLPDLLRAVSDAASETRGWVRLMYAYPSTFSGEMIDTIASLSMLGGGGRILPYIDIPLQHASDRMLTAMRRRVTAGQQRELIARLRERIPGMAIRTTFISGFPGETEDDHRQLLEFVEESAFEAMGVFEYSREDGTPAGTMERDPALAVPAEVKARRRGELMALQQRLAHEQAAYLAEQFDEDSPEDSGVRLDVLIDRATTSRARATSGVGAGGTLYEGRTYFQAPQIDAVTYVQSRESLAPGELVPCAIVGSDGYDLVARPTADLSKRVGLRVLKTR